MFSRYLMVLALAMLLVVGVCASALAQTEDDIAAVKGVHDRYAAAVIAGDLEAWISLWSDDAVRMAPDAPASYGKEDIRAAVEGGFDLFNMQMTIDFAEVVVPGDWAFARGPFTHTLTPKAGGESLSLVGKYLTIFARQADGSWKIGIDSYNYDAPPPAAKQANPSGAPGSAKLAQDTNVDAMYREMCDLYTLAVETGDVDLYVDNYTADGVQMPPDEPIRNGSEQIRAAMEPALTLFDVEIPIYPQEAGIAGDWAFGRCDYSISLTPKEGGPTTTFEGKDLDVFKRQADGSWKYYISNWSLSGPPVVTSVEASSWGQVKAQIK